MVRRLVVGVVALAGLVGGCSQGLDGDPAGRKACDMLVQSREAGDDVKIALGSQLAAGKAAVDAETPAIRDAVGEPVEGLEAFPIIDEGKLEAACEDAGVDIPDA